MHLRSFLTSSLEVRKALQAFASTVYKAAGEPPHPGLVKVLRTHANGKQEHHWVRATEIQPKDNVVAYHKGTTPPADDPHKANFTDTRFDTRGRLTEGAKKEQELMTTPANPEDPEMTAHRGYDPKEQAERVVNHYLGKAQEDPQMKDKIMKGGLRMRYEAAKAKKKPTEADKTLIDAVDSGKVKLDDNHLQRFIDFFHNTLPSQTTSFLNLVGMASLGKVLSKSQVDDLNKAKMNQFITELRDISDNGKPARGRLFNMHLEARNRSANKPAKDAIDRLKKKIDDALAYKTPDDDLHDHLHSLMNAAYGSNISNDMDSALGGHRKIFLALHNPSRYHADYKNGATLLYDRDHARGPGSTVSLQNLPNYKPGRFDSSTLPEELQDDHTDVKNGSGLMADINDPTTQLALALHAAATHDSFDHHFLANYQHDPESKAGGGKNQVTRQTPMDLQLQGTTWKRPFDKPEIHLPGGVDFDNVKHILFNNKETADHFSRLFPEHADKVRHAGNGWSLMDHINLASEEANHTHQKPSIPSELQ